MARCPLPLTRHLVAVVGLATAAIVLTGCTTQPVTVTTTPAAAARNHSTLAGSQSSPESRHPGPGTTPARPSRPPTPPSHPLPTRNTGAITAGPLPGGVDADSATAVALAGVKAILSSDTAIDPDPNATVWRNRVWLTPAFATQVRDYPPTAGPGAQWDTWAAHHARLRVTCRLGGDERPPDTPTTAYRQVMATITPIGAHDWHGKTTVKAIFVALTHTSHGCRIASENG